MATPAQEPETLEPHFRPWSTLPSDLLKLISSHLTDIADYFNFRAVCSPWRSSSSPSTHPLLPLLLLPHSPHSDSLSFLHLPSSRTSTSHLPETRNKIIIGSSFGWLALVSTADNSLSLFNPFTRSLIPLPPLVIPHSPRYLDESRVTDAVDETDSWIAFGLIRKAHPWKISLNDNPSETDDYIVSATLSCASEFAFTRPAKTDKWVFLDSGMPWPNEYVFYHGLDVHILDHHGFTTVIDLVSVKLRKISDPESGLDGVRFHVVDVDGELHMVVYVKSDQVGSFGGPGLKVFRLDESEEEEEEAGLEWCEVSSIGEFAIFLSGNHSSAIRAAEMRGCREDCIYFSGIYGTRPVEMHEPGAHYIDVFDMKERKFEQMRFPWENGMGGMRFDTWITPCLH